MITPITANPQNTVAICTGEIPRYEYIGKFNAAYLKEWAEMVHESVGDKQVYVYCHKSADLSITAKSLAAKAERADSVFVMVCGVEEDREE